MEKDYITLAVTHKVLAEVKRGNEFQRQLAIQEPSLAVRGLIENASRDNKIDVNVGGCITLRVGDVGAIWRVHQAPGQQAADFDDLYSLLSRRAGTAVTLTLTW